MPRSACGVQEGGRSANDDTSRMTQWLKSSDRGAWGMFGLVHSKLVDCVLVYVCVFLYVCICMICFILKLDGSYPRAFLKLFFLFNLLQAWWQRMSSGKDSACASLRKFPFFKYLDGFKLIMNCQRKWFLLSLPVFCKFTRTRANWLCQKPTRFRVNIN